MALRNSQANQVGMRCDSENMNTYAPLFSKIVDSSVWDESDLVVKVFLTMLARKDCDHVVRASAYIIGKWARKTEAEVLEAIKVLESPHTKRIEPQPFDGRRIERVEDGWLLLNGQHYEDMMRDANLKIYKARKAREYRALKRGTPLAGEITALAREAAGDVEGADAIAAERADCKKAGESLFWGLPGVTTTTPIEPRPE